MPVSYSPAVKYIFEKHGDQRDVSQDGSFWDDAFSLADAWSSACKTMGAQKPQALCNLKSQPGNTSVT